MESHLTHLKTGVEKAIAKLKEDLSGIRSSRPTTKLIENIKVEYAGQQMPLKQIGSLGIRPPRELTVTVWDKGIVSQVISAIESAKLGVSISNDGNVVRVFLPPLSEERRKELMKLAKRTTEDMRISVRASRDETNKELKRFEGAKMLTEDDIFTLKEKIQKIIDESNNDIETLLSDKLKELEE